MLILKLGLPEAKVNYNYLGACTSKLVPYTPDKIKGIQMNIEVTGYLADDAFFAYSLTTPDRKLSLHDQMALLGKIGFKIVPVEHYPTLDGAVNGLIQTKAKFAKYNAIWWDLDADAEYKVPDLATIQDVSFTLDANRRLARVLDTDRGKFTVIDHRIPEYYQPGCRVKVWNGAVEPYQSASISVDTPYECPLCHNPLKKYQVAADLPVIYKCTSSFCPILQVSDKPIPAPEIREEEIEDTSFPGQDVAEAASVEVLEESVHAVLDETTEPETTENPAEADALIKDLLKVVNLEVEVDSEEFKDTVQFVTEAPADYVLVNSARSVTRSSRKISKANNIPTITLDDLRRKVNG